MSLFFSALADGLTYAFNQKRKLDHVYLNSWKDPSPRNKLAMKHLPLSCFCSTKQYCCISTRGAQLLNSVLDNLKPLHLGVHDEMNEEWITGLASWVWQEKEWLFSGLGLSILAGSCFLLRWVIGLGSSIHNANIIEELAQFKKATENNINLLISWVELLRREVESLKGGRRPMGFHEDSVPFVYDAASETPQHKGFVYQMTDKSVSNEQWTDGFILMDSIDAQLEKVRDTSIRAIKARKILFWSGLGISVISGLCFFFALT